METSRIKELKAELFSFLIMGGLNAHDETKIKEAISVLDKWLDEVRQLRDEKIRADHE